MAWYRAGTATFTNGNIAVTGSGTAWVSNARKGDAIWAPDGRAYEITNIGGDGALTLATAFAGTTATGAYAIQPTQDEVRSLVPPVTTLVSDFSAVRDNAGQGKFGDGTISQPGIAFAAQTTLGIRRSSTNQASLASGGVDSAHWAQGKLFLGPSIPSGGPNYPVVSFGTGQETANLTDAGNKQGGIYLQGNGVNAGSGGFVSFGTSFGNQTPFAAIKGYVLSGANNTIGHLSTSLRIVDTDTFLTEVIRVDNSKALSVINTNSSVVLRGGTASVAASVGSSAGSLELTPANGSTAIKGSTAVSTRWQGTGGQFFDIYRDASNTSMSSSVGHILHYVPAGQSHIFHVNSAPVAQMGAGTFNLPTPGAQLDIGPITAGGGTPCALDFHSGTTALDYDTRLLSTGGNGTAGNGSLTMYASAGVYFSGPALPNADNGAPLGTSSFRWSTIYAGTGTINTSDARKKTPVAPLTLAELEAATELAREMGTFRFLESVAEKGDAARKHAGMTVQRAIEIMESHGLDPFSYGWICHDTWEERTETIAPKPGRQPWPHGRAPRQ